MTALGAFEIGRVLGAGGSGTVYAARTAAMGGTELALKVLREDVAVTERERARFMEEASCMRRVSHPALVSVVDAGFLPDGRPYVAMPLLPGESLAVRLRRGPIPMAEACAIFDDLAGAVSTLHAAGLVHRDIKPENVLIGPRDGRASAATLLDLGIAREVAAPEGTTTKLGNVRGTPAYMAMERFFGAPASVVTDVYELSVTLYVMLTGALPWRKTEDATERMTPSHPSQSGVAIPEPLAQVILRGLAAKPEARFASVAELARAVAVTAGGNADQGIAPTMLAPRAVTFAPPAAQSDPHAFASTTLAPQLPRAAGAVAPVRSSGSGGAGAVLIAVAIFAGLLVLGVLVGGALSLRGVSATPAPVVSTSPAVLAVPSTSVEVEPTAPPSARPTIASRPPARPSAAPSATPSAVPTGKGTAEDDMRFCEALQGTYCGVDYTRAYGSGLCTSFMAQLVGYRNMKPETRASKNNECLALNRATNLQLQAAKKKVP